MQPHECKSIREWLQWHQSDLAEASGLSIATVKRFETGLARVSEEAIEKLKAAFETAGVEFLAAGQVSKDGDNGFRMKRRRSVRTPSK
jgi:transcriptional regulator with XRE-family HTH domain